MYIILFADDTSVFYSNGNTNPFFATVIKKFDKISKWLKINKPSLNIQTFHAIWPKYKN